MGSLLLVALSRPVMLLLVLLVAKRIGGSVDASADRGVVVLGDLLVGLLGSTSGCACEK